MSSLEIRTALDEVPAPSRRDQEEGRRLLGLPCHGAEREGAEGASRSPCRSRPTSHSDALPTAEAAEGDAAL